MRQLLAVGWCGALVACGGPAFEASANLDLAGGAAGAGGEAITAGTGGSTGGTHPTVGGSGSGGAAAGSAGAGTAGAALAGAGGEAGGSGGAPPAPKCSIEELGPRFIETFTWQSYQVEAQGRCETCEDAPCATFTEVDWTYPFTLEGSSIEADVTIPLSDYINIQIGECGTGLADSCKFRLATSASFRFQLEATETGWKVASVEYLAADPTHSPFGNYGTEECTSALNSSLNYRDDIFQEFQAALLQQSWDCP